MISTISSELKKYPLVDLRFLSVNETNYVPRQPNDDAHKTAPIYVRFSNPLAGSFTVQTIYI